MFSLVCVGDVLKLLVFLETVLRSSLVYFAFFLWPLNLLSSYEEREKCIERIVKNHKELTTFEDFASLVFCPVPKPPGSEPPTPLMSGREPFRMVRVQMAAGESLSDDEKVAAIRLRSKSAVSTPRISSNKIGSP